MMQKEVRMDQGKVVDASDDEDTAGRWVRERDDEQPVELWDERIGELTKLPKKRSSARAQADAMVAAALQRARSSAT